MNKEKKKLFRYSSEASLSFKLDRLITCQQDEFERFEKSPEHRPYLKDCNIYFICRRNRISVKPNSLKATKDSISMYFEFWDEMKPHEFPIAFRNVYNTTRLTTDSISPHSSFKIVNSRKKVLYEAKSSYVVDDYKSGIFPRPDFLDFEILYIGKAMDNSDKPTFNRLISHKTLQKIYSETPPDKEIFLHLFPLFEINGIIDISNSEPISTEYKQQDDARLRNFLETKLMLSRAQQISVAEAAFIKYFEPKYNTHHKETFPMKGKRSYDELYKIDINTVSIKLDTSDQDLYFYTNKVRSSSVHDCSYYLPTEADRRKLFEYSQL